MTTRTALAAVTIVAALTPAVAEAQKRPTVRAPAAILVEPATRDVVFSRRADDRRPIASTTKLMTALLALERLDLDDVLAAVPYAAAPAESICGIRGGERLTVEDYLRCLLVASGNDAAATLAQRIAGSRGGFVRLMNRRAKELGLEDTRYANPIGLDDPDNYSTATDLVKLALILRAKPFFRETTDLERVTLRSGAVRRTLQNRNQLIRRVDVVDGAKTGRTQGAGYVLVGSARKAGVTVVSAVLGAASEAGRQADTLNLLRYGLERYRVRTALDRGRPMGRADLKYRDRTVRLIAGADVRRTARRGERFTLRVLGAPEEIEGPLRQGATVGRVQVRQRGEVVATVPLVTARAVDAASATERLEDFAAQRATVLLAVLFVVCSLLLVLLRRRATRTPAGV